MLVSNSGDASMSPEEGRSSRPRPARESVSRKKACEQCSVAKARCDQKRPRCTRCEDRRIHCDYTASLRPSRQPVGSAGTVDGCVPVHRAYIVPDSSLGDTSMTYNLQPPPSIHSSDSGFATSSTVSLQHDNRPSPLQNQHDRRTVRDGSVLSHRRRTWVGEDTQSNIYWPNQPLNFTDIDLVCTVDVTKIGNRWLGDFIPSYDQRVKVLPPSIIHFITRVFKTYPATLLRAGHLPPFIHPSQLGGPEIPTPLANCLSLVRMWDGQVRGSENMVREIIKNEMARLYEERQLYTPMNQLAAFQSYLIYAMVLFFSDDQAGQLIDRQIMINLQEFACDISSSGLVCPAELSQTRPDWESWIVASTKRRSIYAMYLFDNVFCSLNGLPTFLGEELESLPAPASKTLWEASDRAVWKTEYNRHLNEWPSGALRIDELWPVPETGVEERRKRVDKWLGAVDEFGMMLFAVTLVTHGD